ncbi:FKBP-type peptidyl-prolyl cis-trans isomerase [Methanofollis tationis]|uniref:Peptidyl-prolyl cis-trans isomerase n=1 Tax=Methanofollis tationis TaxID=81417 RepID=A0A7K4HKZ9_9EURY|nr:FKBP-type peptidyl-prolyl cis-trans isomerase [Methanofollis tationis]NVO65852.1 FKBP-type peptidyl-prolyl cis-trans isomerase [Methanofollis tationis]
MASRIALAGCAILAALILAAGCTGTPGQETAATGDNVTVEYTGMYLNGTVFDTSVGRAPLTFMVGGGRVIPGFNDAVIGMAVDETKEVTIPVDEAYGQHRDDLVFYINSTDLPADTAVGQVFLQNSAQFRVVAVNETTVTLDANSPLAGQDLKFTIKLLSIE